MYLNTNKLKLLPPIHQAEKVCSRSAYEPGVNFCKGLLKRCVKSAYGKYSSVDVRNIVIACALVNFAVENSFFFFL